MQINFLTFLDSNFTYLAYLFWHLGDTKCNSGLTLRPQTLGKCRGHAWEDRWEEHITAVRTSGCGVICCLKKFLAGPSEHYCMNTNNNIAKTMERQKCWFGWQASPLCDSLNVCLSSVYGSLNLAYERQIRGENLWCMKVRVVGKSNVWNSRTAYI
jgi:hypothetical protein